MSVGTMNREQIRQCSSYGQDNRGHNLISTTDIHRSCSSFATTSPWSRWIFSRTGANSENNHSLSIGDGVNSSDKVYSILSNCSSPTNSGGHPSIQAPDDSLPSLYPTSWIYENLPPSITPAPAVPDILEASLGSGISKRPSGHVLTGLKETTISDHSQHLTACLPHCACRNNMSIAAGSRSPLEDESKGDARFGFVDRARMVSFKRKKVAPASSTSSESTEPAACAQCTCFLDPVNLSQNQSPQTCSSSDGSLTCKRHDYENAENMNTVIVQSGFALPASGPDLMLAMDSPMVKKSYEAANMDTTDSCRSPKVYLAGGNEASRRNKLNLTIETGNCNTPGNGNGQRNGYLYDPIYEYLMSSPVMRKLKELGFQYPTFPSDGCNKDCKRLRILYFIIAFLLLIIVALIILNVFSPKVMESNPDSHHSFPYIIEPAASTIPVISRTPITNTVSIGDPTEWTSVAASTQTTSHYGSRYVTSSGNFHEASSANTSESAVTGHQNFTLSPNNTSTVGADGGFPIPGKMNFTDIGDVQSMTTEKLPAAGEASIAVFTEQHSTTEATSLFPLSYPADFNCPPDQFKCRSGVSRMPCLYQWERCDGIADCSDGSDEEFCDAIKCFGNFQCRDKSCVALSKVCNGIFDCPDGSDEFACENFKCQSYEYRCPSGYCIPKEWVCDGEADCPGHFDEYNCSATCSPTQFQCPEGWCIASTWRCNGIPDCAGGQDEENCACEKPDQLKCASGGGVCIGKDKICDGTPDCPDSSDEWNCVVLENDSLMIRDQSDQLIPICSQEWSVQDADLACRQLGFGKSERFWEHPLNESLSHVFVRSALTQQLSFAILDRVQFLVKKKPATDCATQKTDCSSDCGHWPGDDSNLTRGRNRRMVGGRTSKEHEWPSVAVLYHPQKKWACTASVIAPFWLITSALCVRRTDASPINWKVIAGNADPSEIDPTRQITRSIVRFVQHPSYKLIQTLLADYDVMLVQLSDQLQLSDETGDDSSSSDPHVSAICMPDTATPPAARCVTAGWGYTTPGGYFINKQLKHLTVDIWPREVCNSTAHYPGLLSERSICVSNDRDDWGPCFNDEGAPLMCQIAGARDRWYLAGVLTAQSCGSAVKHPAVYADVYDMRKWVNGVIGKPVIT